ncbi:MAG: response regulator [bacterium]|nr:response regulator [bacterium]
MTETTHQKKKVLIIEDDTFFANLIARGCRNENLEFEIAIGGEEGVSRAREVSPDLIVLDILMPGIDGFQVLEMLKNEPALAGIPVIVLSNLSQEDDVKKGYALGAVDYLVKASLNLNEIVEKMKYHLAKKEGPKT